MSSPFRHPWWSPYTQNGEPAKPKDDWLIGDIVNSIRDKSQWTSKYKDATISHKWKNEIKQQFASSTKYIDAVIEYVFKELEWIETTENETLGGKFTIGVNDKIVFSDQIVSDQLRAQLTANVDKFASTVEVDYHPNSNDQVIDLVHPSLFPVQYGKSPIVNGDDVSVLQYSDEVAKVKKFVQSFGISEKYQWLPAELKYDNGFTFKSYINNLDPLQNANLYTDILAIFNDVLPGLDYTLSRYASKHYQRVVIPQYGDIYNKEYHDKLDEIFLACRDDDDYSAVDKFEETKRDYVIDLSPKFTEGPVNDVPIKLAEFDKVKVIVKLANIELTPESPSYPGGSWHVEGTINEDIVATVLYYYDVENISESRLSFRTAFEDPEYEQGDEYACEEIYGIADGDKMTRNIGSVEAKQGRTVIFPNSFQHHVDAFELTDKSKKGHRKILCFFIVDPYNDKVVTSAQIPPQQKEWWTNEKLIDHIIPDKLIQGKLKELEGGSWIQTLAEVKLVREEIMKERAAENNEDEDDYGFTREFSLCEH